jgi:opacity protein-like surface antigen
MHMTKLRLRVLLSLTIAATCFTAWDKAAQAQGAAPPGKAAVVILRSDRVHASAPVPVIVNGERIGTLNNGNFLVAIVAPGKVFLKAGDRILSSLELRTAGGGNYFVRIQSTSATLPVRTDMRQVSETTARPLLAHSRFVGRGAAAETAARRILGGVGAPAVSAPPPARVSPPKAPEPARPLARPLPPPSRPQVSRRPAPAPAPEGRSTWNFALSALGGSFKLANDAQSVGGAPSTFDATSRPAVAIEGEWRNSGGPAIGGEVFYYKNQLTNNGTALQADQTVVAVLLNGKYYFRASDWFYPFVGVGAGGASATYSGDLTGKASGAAYQLMAGAEIRFSSVGLQLQYRSLGSTIDDGAGDKVKIGGRGVFAGVSIIF